MAGWDDVADVVGLNLTGINAKRAGVQYVWRMLKRPVLWHHDQARARGVEGFIPSCRVLRFSAAYWSALAVAEERQPWLMGWHSEQGADAEAAAVAVQEFRMRTGAALAAPGVAVSRQGFEWLDAYLDAEGELPLVWHIHIRGAWEEWREQFARFVTWMQLRRVLRPVVVTDVDAGCVEIDPHLDLVSALRQQAKSPARIRWLHRVFWSAAGGAGDAPPMLSASVRNSRFYDWWRICDC